MNERLAAATAAGVVATLAILIGIEIQTQMLAKYFTTIGPKPEVKDFVPDVAKWEAAIFSKMAPTSIASLGSFGPDDPNSYARPDQCAVTNIHLALDIDFDRKVLAGSVVLSVEKKFPLVNALHLDTRDLTIHDITDAKTGEKLKYLIHACDGTFGSSLEIHLPPGGQLNYEIRIKYETSPSSSALQWLSPEQTAGKVHPYLFSQCQAIHARSMLPCQDTPSVKAAYTAEIKAPSHLTVLMGALREKSIDDPSDDKKKLHYFKQPVPIPSYLIAIAVGALESRRIGPRSHVWSEKQVIEKAEYEFGETETMLKTGEDVMGPYIWGKYDLLVLPPSFPFGGMENPCLTFVTPTLLAGDRSLVNVIAHEIAHSWTGNLVTNKNFEHFWLNEGFTTFAERKIVGRIFGESCRHFQAILGWQDLEDSVNRQGAENPLTKLVPDLKGIDPDDAFSTVPYEKGHSLLFYLEELLGGPDKFEPFLREYIIRFQHESIDTQDFKDFLYQFFKDEHSKLDSVDWNAWLHKPGMPPVLVNESFDATLAEACTRLAKRWIDADMFDLSEFGLQDVANFTSLQLCDFLAQLLKADPLPFSKLEVMDKAYGLSVTNNAEVKFRWVRLGIRGHWLDIVPLALQFVTTQGRMKFVRPIFRDLYTWEEVRSKAVETYEKHKSQMMYVTAAMVGKDLHIVGPSE